jgi:acyl carrier protein
MQVTVAKRSRMQDGVAPVTHGNPWMSTQTAAELELAQLLVESLNLEDVEAGAIDPEAPLFNTGLGLDSIDALELALAISKQYGFQLRSDNDENRRIFASLRALSAHVEANKAV